MHKFVFCPSLPLTSERNLNWPSICRHGWAGAFENSQKKCTDKTNKLDQKGCGERSGERSGEHSTKMMTITPLVVIILEWWPWSSYDDHKMTTRTTMVIILKWWLRGHHMVIILHLFSTLWWPWVYPLRQRTTMVIIQNTRWWATVVWRMTTKWWPPNDDHQKWRPWMMATTIKKINQEKNTPKTGIKCRSSSNEAFPREKNAALSIYQHKSGWCPNLLTSAVNKMFGMLRVPMTPIKWKEGPRTPKRQRSDVFVVRSCVLAALGPKHMCRMHWTEIGEHKFGH